MKPVTPKLMTQTVVLPFQIPNVFEGLAEASGIARATSSELTLEFEVKDAIFGLLRSDIRTVTLPLEQVVQAEFKPGRFGGNRVILATDNLTRFDCVPRHRTGQITLWVKRKEVETAQRLVSFLRSRKMEHELEGLSQEIAQFGGNFAS